MNCIIRCWPSDSKEERVNEVLPYVTSAQIGDGTNEDFLASLGVGNFDVRVSSLSATTFRVRWRLRLS